MFGLRSFALTLALAALALAGNALAEGNKATLAVKVDTKSLLNEPTALANKNAVMSAQNVAVTRSNIRGQQDDIVTITTDEQEQAMAMRDAGNDLGAQPNDVPAGLVLTGDRDNLKSDTEHDEAEDATIDSDAGELASGGDAPPSDLKLTGERDVLTSPDGAKEDGDHDEALEQFVGYRRRFFYPGFRGGYYGWRYPLPYWRRYGRRFYGGRCAFGRVYGGYFYC